MKKNITVLIVDDSALIRKILSEIINGIEGVEVVGTAPDALKAREMIKALNPDVLTLDIEMPKMNGVDFLRKIMALRPMPVVMISSLTQHGASITLECLEIGAVDFVSKPTDDFERTFEDIKAEIAEKIKLAAHARVFPHAHENELPSSAKLPRIAGKKYELIVIGASTGGVEAIREILNALPDNMPPIVIVQHMPKHFTPTFAKRLDNNSRLLVEEVCTDKPLQTGHVYLAPGDQHITVVNKAGILCCSLKDDAAVNGHKPAVGVLFESATIAVPEKTIAVMLSGMGRDGADEMAGLRQKGAYTIGQNENSCVVYGMPRAAKLCDAIQDEMELSEIAGKLVKLCGHD